MIEYSILFSENRAEAIVRHFLSSSPYYRLIDNSDPVYSVTFKLAEETDKQNWLMTNAEKAEELFCLEDHQLLQGGHPQDERHFYQTC